MKWYFKLAAVALALLLVWGAVRLYRSYVVAIEDARRAEARREWVEDSVRLVFEEQQREIDAAQGRIIELSVLTVEIEKDLEVSKDRTDELTDEIEEALPATMKHLAKQLRDAHELERMDWLRLVGVKDSTILEKDKIIFAQGEMLRADTAVIESLRKEAEKWKKAANSSFNFNVGSSLVTGLLGLAAGLGIAAAAGS